MSKLWMHCRGRQIKDIAWFMIIMSVLLLFIGAGAVLLQLTIFPIDLVLHTISQTKVQ